jgi:hypothetical protein
VRSSRCEALISFQDSSKGRVFVVEKEISRLAVRVLVEGMAIRNPVSSCNGKRPAVVEIFVEEVIIFSLILIILALRWDRDPISLSMGTGTRGSRILTTKLSTRSLVLLMRVTMMAVTGLIKEVVLVVMQIIVSVVRSGHHIMGVGTMVVVIVVEEGITGR